jgi:hypothetical protein
MVGGWIGSHFRGVCVCVEFRRLGRIFLRDFRSGGRPSILPVKC